MSSTNNSFMNHVSKMNHTFTTPCRYGKECRCYPNCAFYHSLENTPDCRFGDKCKKRDTCPFVHPDQRSFVPRRKAPPPPKQNIQPSSCPNKDSFGRNLVYDEKGVCIGLIDNGHFVSFLCEIPLDVQEADNSWDKEINGLIEDGIISENGIVYENDSYSEHPADLQKYYEDEFETDEEAYPKHPADLQKYYEDEFETDEEAYPEYPVDTKPIN